MNESNKANPCELNGFAFLEFSGPNGQYIYDEFIALGFQAVAKHPKEPITLFKQGNIQFILNSASNCQAEKHAKIHGPGACAMGFRVNNAQHALEYARKNGAKIFQDANHTDHSLPAIEAIGGSVIYFVDEQHQPFTNQWILTTKGEPLSEPVGLCNIDHLTHNVFRGNMDKWEQFYKSIFNFHEIRFFDIKGEMTGLVSRALSSPCGKIKIPLNESKDEHSQIEEFLHEFHGEGIQHVALETDDIYHTVNSLKKNGIHFLDVPETYYEMLEERIPWHQEPLNNLRKGRILIDGEKDPSNGLLLQIFTENIFGPVFFEIIQRKGNQGFGEGNFQALFEAIERDQIKRGTLEKKIKR